jgi:hypothetical protein
MADLDDLIAATAQRYGIEPSLLSAMVQTESNRNPRAVSPAGAQGLTQLMPGTARGLGVRDPFDAAQNLDGGARYLRQQIDRFGSPALALAAYNAGPARVARSGGIPAIPETQRYVSTVMSRAGLAMGGSGQSRLAGSDQASDGELDRLFAEAGGAPAKTPQLRQTNDPLGRKPPAGAKPASDSELDGLFAEVAPMPQAATKSGGFSKSASVVGAGFRQVGRNFGADYNARLIPSIAQMVHDTTPRITATPARIAQAARNPGSALQFMGDLVNDFPVLRAGRAALSTVGALTSPVMAAADQFVGRPISQLSGGRINPQFATDMASLAFPMLQEANAARLTNAGARAARMTAPGYALTVRARQATQAQLAADARAAAQAAKAASRRPAPVLAAVSASAAEQQAGRRLATQATDIQAVRSRLANGPRELVPGAVPTTFQQTGDMGLGAMERQMATQRPDLFKQRGADQNQAMVSALEGVQTGGDPLDLARSITRRFDDLDQEHEARIAGLTEQAQTRAQGLGGVGTPEGYGADLRSVIADAEAGVRQREGALWQAVDPHNDLTGNMTRTRDAAREIAAAVPRTAKPMAGEEAQIFGLASSLPAVAPVSELIALRSRLSSEMRAELMTNGRSPAYARLSQLRGAIQDNLTNSIADRVALDEAKVARGELAPEDAFGRWFRSGQDAWVQQRAEAGRASASALGGYAGGGAGSLPGSYGTEGAPGGQSALPSRAAGLPGTTGGGGAPASWPPRFGLTPTFDRDAAGRLELATEATRQRARTYGLAPVSNITAKAGASDLYRLADGNVPARFFRAGPGGYDAMQAALRASPDALPILEDYAALSLRNAAIRDGGIIDPAAFARWSSTYGDALRAFPPSVRARFADAAAASRTVRQAASARVQAVKEARSGALGRILGLTEHGDVVRSVGSILNGRTSVADMKALADEARHDPVALAGLRQAIAEFMSERLLANVEAGASGVARIKADAFQSFVKRNRPALAEVFEPDELRTFDSVAENLQRMRRSDEAVRLAGPGTAQDLTAVNRGQTARGIRTVLDVLASALGGAVGHSVGGPAGGVAMSAASGMAADALQGLHAAGIARVDQLVTQALLDPEVARALLAKVGPTNRSVAADPAVGQALRALMLSNGLASGVTASKQLTLGNTAGP